MRTDSGGESGEGSTQPRKFSTEKSPESAQGPGSRGIQVHYHDITEATQSQ